METADKPTITVIPSAQLAEGKMLSIGNLIQSGVASITIRLEVLEAVLVNWCSNCQLFYKLFLYNLAFLKYELFISALLSFSLTHDLWAATPTRFLITFKTIRIFI